MPTQAEIEAAEAAEAAEESSGLVTELNTIEETTIGTAAIEANANQFKYILLESNVLKDDIKEIYNVEAYSTHVGVNGELVRDYDNSNDIGEAQGDTEYVVRHSDEHINLGAAADGSSGASNNSTPVSTAIDHSNNEVAKAIHPIAAAEVFTSQHVITTYLKDLGIKVVEQALKDFRAGVEEDPIVFPNKTSYKGPRVDTYLQTIACTPGTTPWGTGAVATWFNEVGAELPPGMDTATPTKYQRSSIAGWLNWARDTKHFALSPLIGAAVVIGTKVAKKHKRNKASLIEEVPIALGICQAVLETGEIVCLTTENYTVDEYEIPPTQSEIDSYLTANPPPFLDDLIFASAFDLLVLKEGFGGGRPGWDKDWWRIGYGSSTLTLTDGGPPIKMPNDKTQLPIAIENGVIITKDIGNVVELYGEPHPPPPKAFEGYIWHTTNQKSNLTHLLKPSMIITKEQAQYDLKRRVKEFYRKRVEIYFTPEERSFYGPYVLAAMTSGAYNFGSFGNRYIANPTSIIKAGFAKKDKSLLINFIASIRVSNRGSRADFEAAWASKPWVDPNIVQGQTTTVNIPGKTGVRLVQAFVNPTKILGYILPKALDILEESLPDNIIV